MADTECTEMLRRILEGEAVGEDSSSQQENDENNDFEELLISEVKKRKCLYSMQRSDYKDRIMKNNCWREIGNVLKKPDTVCKNRWKSLRDTYVREKKKRERFLKSGAEYIPNKQWKFFQLLMFLDDDSSFNDQSDTNFSQTAEVECVALAVDNYSMSSAANTSSACSSTAASSVTSEEASVEVQKEKRCAPYFRKKRTAPKELDAFERAILMSIADPRKTELESLLQDESSLYGLSVGSRLKKLEPRKQALAKMEIEKVLFSVEFSDD